MKNAKLRKANNCRIASVLHGVLERGRVSICLLFLGAVLFYSGPLAAASPCKIQAVNFEGWQAQEISNQWVKLMIVPQVGGRLMQVTFAGHPYLFINEKLKGKCGPSVKPSPRAARRTRVQDCLHN